jgi:CubicO group peptidase (beta-lactamase class C family)
MLLRHLLSHSSGLGYTPFSPLLRRWRESRGESVVPSQRSLIEPVTTPLLCEPENDIIIPVSQPRKISRILNRRCVASPEIAGMMIARANGMTLSEYTKKYMWEPLGITNATFHLEQRPDMKERMPEASMRQGGTHPLFLTVRDPNGKLEWGINPILT